MHPKCLSRQNCFVPRKGMMFSWPNHRVPTLKPTVSTLPIPFMGRNAFFGAYMPNFPSIWLYLILIFLNKYCRRNTNAKQGLGTPFWMVFNLFYGWLTMVLVIIEHSTHRFVHLTVFNPGWIGFSRHILRHCPVRWMRATKGTWW